MTSSGWTRQRRCEYRQTTVQEPWGATLNVYRTELEVTSRINRYLTDAAFRNIALGENYFRLLGLAYEAPPVCTD